jgi:hypothetical protein
MAYRGDEGWGARWGDSLEAPTAEGPLRLELGPRQVKLTVGRRSLQIVDKFAKIVHHEKKPRTSSTKIEGKVVVARDVPHEDLGVWIEIESGMRRLFGVEPVSLLEPTGLASLRRLDALAQKLRVALADFAGDIRRAVEIGRGVDKVLLADHGDRWVVYARRLFRDRAQFTMAIHGDGRIIVPDGKKTKQIVVQSRFGVTVWGDYVRFADRHGADLAKVSIPWIGPEDRDELARRIGQLVDRASSPKG